MSSCTWNCVFFSGFSNRWENKSRIPSRTGVDHWCLQDKLSTRLLELSDLQGHDVEETSQQHLRGSRCWSLYCNETPVSSDGFSQECWSILEQAPAQWAEAQFFFSAHVSGLENIRLAGGWLSNLDQLTVVESVQFTSFPSSCCSWVLDQLWVSAQVDRAAFNEKEKILPLQNQERCPTWPPRPRPS